MLRSVNGLKGFAITAIGGPIGDVDQFYFDDEAWAIRYLVVNTGTWLASRQVLISPISVKQVDPAINQLFVSLTRDQVKHSPNVDMHKPVSRQYEEAFLSYYGYPNYWGGPYLWGAAVSPAALAMPRTGAPEAAAASVARARAESQDMHLRSTKEVTGYHIQALDDEAGHVEDFIADDETWAIRYLVVDTRNWWPGKKVLVSPQWIERVSWPESKVFIDLTREQIKHSPEYNEAALISREYENALYKYYGRPGYWNKE